MTRTILIAVLIVASLAMASGAVYLVQKYNKALDPTT